MQMLNGAEAENIEKEPAVFASQRGYWFLAALVGLSLVIRLNQLSAPLIEDSLFRQTQTALTVYWYFHDGIDLFDPQLPVLGPPWRVPFEFPIYQACAAFLARTGNISVDAACRLTNVLFFYAAAAQLFVLCQFLFERRRPAVFVLVCFLFSPFCIEWSRTAAIEYAAVAFALSYLYWFLRWIRQPQRLWMIPIILVMGVLGALTKITTMGFTVVPLILASLVRLLKRDEQTDASRMDKWLLLGGIPLLCLVPIVIGYMWIIETDRVKAASVHTAWLTSKQLASWNYGTLDQRLDLRNWLKIFIRIPQVVVAKFMAFLPFIAILSCFRQPRADRLIFLGAVGSVLFPIAVFFNLYVVHDYYLVAITPGMAVLAGMGLEVLCSRLSDRSCWNMGVICLTIAISLGSGWRYLARCFYPADELRSPVLIGNAVHEITGEDDNVLIIGQDWSSATAYYSQRRCCMIRPPYVLDYDEVPAGKITAAVTDDLEHPVLKRWPERSVVSRYGEFSILRLSPER